MWIICFILSSFWKDKQLPNGRNACSCMGDKCQPKCMQIKWLKWTMLGVPPPFHHWPSEHESRLTSARYPRAILKLGEKVFVDSYGSRYIPFLKSLSLCVESLYPLCNPKPKSWVYFMIVELVWEACAYFPSWLLWPRSARLHMAYWPVWVCA